MKKISLFLFGLMAISASVVMNSCTPAGEDTDPILSLTGDVVGDQEMAPGATFGVSINAVKNTDGANLKELKISSNASNTSVTEVDTVIELSGSEANLSFTFKFNAVNEGDSEVWTLTLYDKDNNTDVSKFTLTAPTTTTTVTDAIDLTSVNAVVIGDVKESTSSAGSYASSAGTVYMSSQAIASAASVDFIYGTGYMYAPSDAGVSGNVGSMSPLNATKFLALTGTSWDEIKTDLTIPAGTPSATSVAISTGSIVKFTTAGGVTGVFEVNSVTAAGSSAAAVSIDIKYYTPTTK